jgi:hypothetical protein
MCGSKTSCPGAPPQPPWFTFPVNTSEIFSFLLPENILYARTDYLLILCPFCRANVNLRPFRGHEALRTQDLQKTWDAQREDKVITNRWSLLRPFCFLSPRQCLRVSLQCVAAQMPWPPAPMQRNTAGNFIIAGSRFPCFYASCLYPRTHRESESKRASETERGESVCVCVCEGDRERESAREQERREREKSRSLSDIHTSLSLWYTYKIALSLIYILIYIHTYKYIYHTYIHINIHMYIITYLHTYESTYIHKYVHTYI